MSHPLEAAIENSIKAAEAAGEFDDLPGAGKPLAFLTNPKDAVLDRIMTEAKAKPPVVTLKMKILELHQALKAETDDSARKAIMTEISGYQLKLDLELEAVRKYG